MCTLIRFVAIVASVFAFAGLTSAQTSTWNQTGSGTYSWTDAINWSGGVPNSNNAAAVFSNTGAGASKTVTVAGLVTVERLQINSTQSNPMTIDGGTLRFRNVGGGGTSSPLTIDSQSSPVTYTITSTIDADGSSGNRLFTVGTNATLNFTGAIVNSASSATYTIQGGGTTILSGSNGSFTGGITTSGSGTTLAINGTVGSPITVGAGTTLTGSGSTTGTVTVNSGGNLAGTMSMGGLNLGAGSINYTSIVGGTPASPVNQKLTINGPLAAQAGTALNFTLVDDGSLIPGGTYTITLLDAASISGLTAAQVTATAANFGFAGTPFATIDSDNGNVNLTFTVVPEPASVLGIGAVGLGGVWLRRRRMARA